jgi:hypothetical protein
VLTRWNGGRHAIAGYSPIVPTDTSDHEYPAILESERENEDDVYRVELRVAHDPLFVCSCSDTVRGVAKSGCK